MTLAAPFPWFGGKSRVAPVVWERFGDVANYVEPFFGSGAVLLGRPPRHRGKVETVNDIDGFVSNFWRSVVANPALTASHADWPVNENDLHARHVYLVSQRADLTARLEGDPTFFDAKIAGWWAWGSCAWIGSGFCSGAGPWRVADGRLVLGNAGRGINRQLPHLGDGGQGIYQWFNQLAARMRRVRVCCGDWTRVVTDSVTIRHGLTGVFLDPPYGSDIEQTRVYATDDSNVAARARGWCAANGDNPQLRIALCGYVGEGHEVLAGVGWSEYAWKAHGGYGGGRGGIGDANSRRERIWFSPHCLPPASGSLLDLLDDAERQP